MWTAQMSLSCPQNLNFLSCQRLECFFQCWVVLSSVIGYFLVLSLSICIYTLWFPTDETPAPGIKPVCRIQKNCPQIKIAFAKLGKATLEIKSAFVKIKKPKPGTKKQAKVL
jgi:hypothetical protein